MSSEKKKSFIKYDQAINFNFINSQHYLIMKKEIFLIRHTTDISAFKKFHAFCNKFSFKLS
jgi:hypothetical protein